MIGWLYREVYDSVFDPSDDVIGPWSPAFQHGGPPFALAYHCAQREVGNMVPLSGHLDFIRPVRVCRTNVEVKVMSTSRRTCLADVSLLQDSELVVRASLWFKRADALVPGAVLTNHTTDIDFTGFPARDSMARIALDAAIGELEVSGMDTPMVSLGRDEEGIGLPWINDSPGFVTASKWRLLNDEFGYRSQSRALWRYEGDVVDGYKSTFAELIFLAADSVWSVSRQFRFSDMTAVNVGIDIDYIKDPKGMPLLIAGETPMTSGGGIAATGGLFDSLGLCAIVSQPMVPSLPRTTKI